MRILELTLKNFLPILSGMGKEEIHLDLRDSNELISVFIGKIGSGKTFILSHLQPFSTVGTLDVRNNDDMIVPEKDGQKTILYEKDSHEYAITHIYTWTGKTHTKKSYIQKDGIELNENGNSTSFKDIIQLEFGIDQSFLRLLRLGPNVINFINMKATERKSYIASLLDDTEIYLSLYKAWSTELRTLNTKATILMNKLNSYGVNSVDELIEKESELGDTIKDITTTINEKTQTKYKLQAENSTLMDGMTYSEVKEKQTQLVQTKESSARLIEEIESKLKLFDSYPELVTVSKDIGRLDQKLQSSQDLLYEKNQEYNQCITSLNSANDKKAIAINEDHMTTLKTTYEYLMNKDKEYQSSLRNFSCDYSSAFLSALLEEINYMNILINEISQYDKDAIRQIYNSDSSCISYANNKIEILGYKKLKIERMINNLKFAEGYHPASQLYFPPFCPTHSCPYYQTHPYTLQKQANSIDKIKDEVMGYQNELKDLDVEISKYSDYSIIYSKISTLKEYWKKVKPILESIFALNHSDLKDILLNQNYQVWYDYNKVVDTIDLVKKRDSYYELTERIKSIKNEITELEISDNESIDKEIASLTYQKESLEKEIEKCEILIKETKDELITYNKMYVDLSEKSQLESSLEENRGLLKNATDLLAKYEINNQKIQDNIKLIQSYDLGIAELTSKLKATSSKVEEIKTRLNDIKYTNKELDEVLLDQKYMTQMVDAVSSKKGIPLVMIQIFLDSCRDILNDMLYSVCEDDMEVLPFKINDTEFKIPYMVNGQVIDDISKASQGQSSIVSTCMSFALVKQSGSTSYNIPLLDEMDGPLHKKDKQKFIAILLRYLEEIGSEQCFVITHDDNVFDGYPVQVIMTTDENVNRKKYTNVIKL